MSPHEAHCLASTIADVVREAFIKHPNIGAIQVKLHPDTTITVSAMSVQIDNEDNVTEPLPFYRLSVGRSGNEVFRNLVQNVLTLHRAGAGVFYPSVEKARIVVIFPAAESQIAPLAAITVRLP